MFAFIVLCSYLFEWKWTGLVKSHHFHIHIHPHREPLLEVKNTPKHPEAAGPQDH